MLTADTLLHTVSPMLHPLLHPPAPTSLCCTAEHRQMFNSPRLPSVFSPFSLPHVCRAQHRPSIPPLLSSPSLPPFSLLHLSASLCSATLLCSALPTYSTPSAGRRRKAKGKHTHTHTHTGSASTTTLRSHWKQKGVKIRQMWTENEQESHLLFSPCLLLSLSVFVSLLTAATLFLSL